MRWISVKERLPEVGQKVLIFARFSDGRTFFEIDSRAKEDGSGPGGGYGADGWEWHEWDRGDVTHWQPLPEPPHD